MIGAAFLGATILTPLYSIYERTFGFSKITLALIYSVYVIGNLLALLLFGSLSDQLGRKRIGIVSMGLAIVSVLLFLFADGTAWLYAGRVLGGFAVGIASGTGTAWLVEIYGPQRRPEATVMATASNMTGIAFGPLIGGLLAQYAPDPLKLPFIVNIIIIVVAAALIWLWPPETVQQHGALRQLDFTPRIGVPKEIRARFIAPAVSAFAIFALGGFYFSLIPSVLRESLHNTNRATAGAIVFEMVAVMVVVIVLTRELESYTAMFTALAGLIPAAGLLVTAQLMSSMPLLLIAGVLIGVVFGLGYRGGLQVVNAIAPADRRAEVASSYFLACFSGNSIPVIGVGVLSAAYGLDVASSALAAMVGVLAIFALVVGLRTSRG